MNVLDELRDHVIETGFFVREICQIHDSKVNKAVPVYASHAIHILSEALGYDDIRISLCPLILSPLVRFLNDDFGNFEELGYENYAGLERGCYPSPLGDTPDEGAIMVHREGDKQYGSHICIYLQFED